MYEGYLVKSYQVTEGKTCLSHPGCITLVTQQMAASHRQKWILPWMLSSSFNFSPLMSVAVTWAPSFANAYSWKTWVSSRQSHNVWTWFKTCSPVLPLQKRNMLLWSCDSNKYAYILKCITAVVRQVRFFYFLSNLNFCLNAHSHSIWLQAIAQVTVLTQLSIYLYTQNVNF